MKEIRMLTDADIEMIVDYSHRTILKNGTELFIDTDMKAVLLKEESFLRKSLFDGMLIFVAEIEDGEIQKLIIVGLPNQNTKSAVINIYFTSRDIEFIKQSMEYIKVFMSDSIYSKIRITLYGNKYNNVFEEELLANGFKSEIKVNTCVGSKTLLCYKII